MKKLKDFTSENLDVSRLMNATEMIKINGGDCNGGIDGDCTDSVEYDYDPTVLCHNGLCKGGSCQGLLFTRSN